MDSPDSGAHRVPSPVPGAGDDQDRMSYPKKAHNIPGKTNCFAIHDKDFVMPTITGDEQRV